MSQTGASSIDYGLAAPLVHLHWRGAQLLDAHRASFWRNQAPAECFDFNSTVWALGFWCWRALGLRVLSHDPTANVLDHGAQEPIHDSIAPRKLGLLEVKSVRGPQSG